MHSAQPLFEYSRREPVGLCELELVTAARAGSDEAFAELHNLFAHRLYRTILSIMKNREDAEDVLQDTLIRAFLALDSFEGRSKLVSWLTRIAINSSLMALRKRRVRPESSLDSLTCCEDQVPPFESKDPRPNPEESCLQIERNLRASQAIAKLKPALRTVVHFQMKHECSMKDIARSLDVSVATVKARLHRARRGLREATRTRHEGTRLAHHFSPKPESRI